ncbi:transmembrane protein 74B-like [Mercenaria mercenaria]|uniref:transmembrane protein 74B-like n=1 Tax=Mercenaria mercenaria TaxID=6596 RepID=UPI001E1D3DD7|nr:transmembrane protein 74B-like [Mercenaria mercenaria]
MVTELERIEDSNIRNEEENCHWLDCLNPKKDMQEFLTTIAIILMSCGVAIMCVSFIVPREHVFDPSLPAREMEKIEIHYAKLSYYLDICTVIGMSFIAAGGLITSGVFVYYFIMPDREVYRKKDRQDLNLLTGTQREMVSYGTSNDG